MCLERRSGVAAWLSCKETIGKGQMISFPRFLPFYVCYFMCIRRVWPGWEARLGSQRLRILEGCFSGCYVLTHEFPTAIARPRGEDGP